MSVNEFASRVLKGVAGSERLVDCSTELPSALQSNFTSKSEKAEPLTGPELCSKCLFIARAYEVSLCKKSVITQASNLLGVEDT